MTPRLSSLSWAFALSLALLAAAVPPSHGQSAKPPETTRLEPALQKALDEYQRAGTAPGVSAGFALADGRSFGLAAGLADKSAKRPMTPDALMLQGSVGKTYVAAVALQLVHEGKLRLDDKVSKYLGGEEWFARLPNGPDITVRMLMNHTSGIVRYELNRKFLEDLTRDPYKVWLPAERLRYVLDGKPPFAAGKGWEYSDTNYIVLGMVIEHVTGADCYAEIKRRVLTPLGLKHTVPSDSTRIPGLVQGYAGARNVFGGRDEMLADGKFALNPQFEWCGGGMASTTQDLARWMKLFYDGRAFDKSLLPEVLNGVPAKLGPDVKYGLAAMIRPTPAGLSYGHAGFFPGYLTDVMYFPDGDFAIAVQVNTSVPRTLNKPTAAFLADLAAIVKKDVGTKR